MAIPHAHPAQAVDVSPLGNGIKTSKSVALFKAADLEVMRLVLAAGKSLPPHKVPGDITVHCLEGRIDVVTSGQSHVLGPGQLLYVPGQVEHAVSALDDASALVTVALKK
jgi:quercetin dioxygenase-like cupin family protein